MIKATRKQMDWIASGIRHAEYGASVAREIEAIESQLSGQRIEDHADRLWRKSQQHYLRVLKALRDDQPCEYGQVQNHKHDCGLVCFTGESIKQVKLWLGR